MYKRQPVLYISADVWPWSSTVHIGRRFDRAIDGHHQCKNELTTNVDVTVSDHSTVVPIYIHCGSVVMVMDSLLEN